MAVCEHIFQDTLEGHPLISNNSVWRRFPKIHNQYWSHGKYVLLGDALHTAHFSIGSGTRLAMEDAIELDKSIAEYPRDIPSALQRYEQRRRPVLEKLVTAANASADWYEHFTEHMSLEPPEFAMCYIQRSGRIDPNRLKQISPDFCSRYAAERSGSIS